MRIGLPAASFLAMAVLQTGLSRAAEERITGVLEKTTKEGACCQIRDALKDLYFVEASGDVAKICNEMLGRKVVVTGVVEKKGEDYFVAAKKVAEAPVIRAPLPEPPPKEAPKETPGKEESKEAKKETGDAKETSKDAKEPGGKAKAEEKSPDVPKEPAKDAPGGSK
ncbi:MAG: hypothetical protein N3A38_08115 [Planctomycetota bacterium]|nr:hypothetical protein [Planctomycetota bacterium]